MRPNDFQLKIEVNLESDFIEIGCIKGSKKVLFIKTGQNGTIYGYENKYLNLAFLMNEKYGCTVFVSATRSDSKEVYDKEMQLVADYFEDPAYEIYYMGISKGGLIGCWYALSDEKIKKMVSVNAPLMINFHNRTLPAVKNFGHDKLTMIYGSLDPSYRYVDFISKYVAVKIVEGADHQFQNKESLFEDITVELLNN